MPERPGSIRRSLRLPPCSAVKPAAGPCTGSTGSYLDGARRYALEIPNPVPAGLFWSVTVYDAITRSQISTDQSKAALRSLFELSGDANDESVVLHFGPDAPDGDEAGHWIKTIRGRGWFVYLRLYGPTAEAFDGSWTPGDFTAVE